MDTTFASDSISLAFCPVCSLSFTHQAGLSFDLLSADLYHTNAPGMTITGYLAGGGTVQIFVSNTIPSGLQNHVFDNGWNGLTSVVIEVTGGVGSAIDNIAVNVVPVPAAAWLFASGLGLLAWVRNRQA